MIFGACTNALREGVTIRVVYSRALPDLWTNSTTTGGVSRSNIGNRPIVHSLIRVLTIRNARLCICNIIFYRECFMFGQLNSHKRTRNNYKVKIYTKFLSFLS